MKFFILAVGNKMPEWVNNGFANYAIRMPKDVAIELINIKPEKRSKNKKISQLLCSEANRIFAAIPPKCRTVVLDERGRQWSTEKLAESISRWMTSGGDTAFIIGGADGLDSRIKDSADEALALSTLTLPHGLVRVMLSEQLYRAISLIKQHPYHRK
ncbi:MAG: 23S rRNA (pseudouridine(1915)-N(3))-methyltransferase RlmH [Nitrosomonadaceae bacterium]|nr:23S rRNA (pseudouridine(1915)-N(3))-methyltransferase RlmH [Nitrosomonadaceae bacterium]|tara:strand:+ start:978 stop:1448 length:471 start_codon:yes stop_codon:yes gene_type:complete